MRNYQFPSLTIRTRLISMGILATVGFASLVGVGWYSGGQTLDAAVDAEALNGEIQVINDMRVANIEMVLAAMDSIIDKSEGQLLPERREVIDASIAMLRDNQSNIFETAELLGQPELVATMEPDLAEVEQAISIDLPALIKANASEAEFAALDDAIDGGGERMNAALTTLAALGNEMVQERLLAAHDTATSARQWQIALAVTFMVLILLVMGFTVRSVSYALSRFGRDMEAIASGNIKTEIEAEQRNDEVGQMAKSLIVFRDAAVQKLELEREAAENRSSAEHERLEREALKEREARMVKDAVDLLADALKKLADGDLSARINTPFMDGLDKLRVDFNRSVDQLNRTLAAVKENISTIHDDATEMRSAADELSRRTEQQAASLEETSAALEEIAATVRNASERVEEASSTAGHAKSSTERSGVVVAEAVEAMKRIETASGEISTITNVIDEIAFQTNLLALNAGVEAARAGEAGKGFAVVAQEVRELAQRAASAAREIKHLIQNSGKEVTSGVALVRSTGEALQEISSHVSNISDHMSSIATSAREQATGLQQINVAVSQMDQMTQKNAAMVEENTAVTHRLAGEADNLTALIGRFRITDLGSQRPAVAA